MVRVGRQSMAWLLCILVLVAHQGYVDGIRCYECTSVFPGDRICLSPCSDSFLANSTCILIRNTPKDISATGSVRATHIVDQSSIGLIEERQFLFGSEEARLNPIQAVGWEWTSDSITYGCDSDRCNNPQIVNDLPAVLNGRVPSDVLNNNLKPDNTVNYCYSCSGCFSDSTTSGNLAGCINQTCTGGICSFQASRFSQADVQQCGNNWHFSSRCRTTATPTPQIQMDLMYYTRSDRTKVYRIVGDCLGNNCNNLATVRALTQAVTVKPDLTCSSYLNQTTTTRAPSSTTISATASTTARTSSTTPTTPPTTARTSSTTPTTTARTSATTARTSATTTQTSSPTTTSMRTTTTKSISTNLSPSKKLVLAVLSSYLILKFYI